jgi:hypothetical protein
MKSIGIAFEEEVENFLNSFDEFSNCLFDEKDFINIFTYRDYVSSESNKKFLETFQNDSRNLLLLRQVPLTKKIDFCLFIKTNRRPIKCWIECKFLNSEGTFPEKNYYPIVHYQDKKSKEFDEFFILLYDGEHYKNNPKTINESIEVWKQYSDIMFIDYLTFKDFLSEYLTTDDFFHTFEKYNKIIKNK